VSTSLPYLPGFACRQVCRNSGVLVTGGPIVMFTIAGGRVRLVDLVGVVSTVIGAGATSLAINANPSTGVDTPICAVGVVTVAPANSLVAITGIVADALVVILATQGAIKGMTTPLILNPGTLDLVITGGTTGAIDWYATWEPIDAVSTFV